jgi:hypothetical protein
MKNRLCIGFGVLLTFGLLFMACDNDNSTTSKGEYHLEWGITSSGNYNTIISAISSQGLTVAENDGNNWALLTGSNATTMYNYCMDRFYFSDDGDFDGSFEECANFSKDGVTAPSGLKVAVNGNKANAPLAGIFLFPRADGTNIANLALVYITKN